MSPSSLARKTETGVADFAAPARAVALRPMTVLQVVPTLDAGAADLSVIDAARVLAHNGHRAVVAARGGRLEAQLHAAGGEFVHLDLASKNPFVILSNAARLARLIRREQCDLVHAHGRTAAWSGYIASRVTRVPFVTSWYKGFREQNVFKRLYNGVMARGDRIIAVGEQIAELIGDRYQTPSERIVVMPPSVDTSVFDPAQVSRERIDAVRLALGVDDTAKIVLVLGRMLRRKGHEVVVKAISRLKQRGLKDFICVFLGEEQEGSRYTGEIWDLVLACDIADVVRLPAQVDDILAIYAASCAAVSAAIQPEGIQRAILEAQAMKVPLIVSDLAAGPEAVLSPPAVPEDRMSGLRVPAGDDAALAAALFRLFSLPEAARRAIGERGRAFVASQFDARAASEQTLALYAEVAGLRAAGRRS